MHDLCSPEKQSVSDESPSLAMQAKCFFPMIHILQLHKHFACTDDEKLLSKIPRFSRNTVCNTLPFFFSIIYNYYWSTLQLLNKGIFFCHLLQPLRYFYMSFAGTDKEGALNLRSGLAFVTDITKIVLIILVWYHQALFGVVCTSKRSRASTPPNLFI